MQVTDANGCSASVTVTITQSGSLNLTATPGTITCNGGTTSVTLAATGGTSPYTYGGTTTNLTAGTYNFTVTDAAGCSAATTVTITQPPPITITQAVTNVTCNGASGGSVVITPAAEHQAIPSLLHKQDLLPVRIHLQ
jgi:hypothetical protein